MPKGDGGLIVAYFGGSGILCCMSSYPGKCLDVHLVEMLDAFYYSSCFNYSLPHIQKEEKKKNKRKKRGRAKCN